MIDRHLRALPSDGAVLHLGCGPNQLGEVDNLADTMATISGNRMRLFAADTNPKTVEILKASLSSGFGLGRNMISVLQLDATDMAEAVVDSSLDLILALGLFGDLRFSPGQRSTRMDDPSVKRAYARVLSECHRVLKPGGFMLICNSAIRQPLGEFVKLVLRVGFIEREREFGTPVGVVAGAENERYLLTISKAKPPQRAGGKSLAPYPSATRSTKRRRQRR